MIGRGGTVFAVWTYAIANKSQYGKVELNPHLLAAVIGDPVEEIGKALDYLCSPDELSRTKDHDGRRLIREGQFDYVVVNAAKYGYVVDLEARRAGDRERKHRERERAREGHTSNVPRETSPPAAAPKRAKAGARGCSLESWLSGHGDHLEEKVRHMANWCRTSRADLNPAATFESFRDYWKANANQRTGKKIDWDAAWRNWVRKEPVAKPGQQVSDGKITCRGLPGKPCGKRVSSHTDGLCDACYRER